MLSINIYDPNTQETTAYEIPSHKKVFHLKNQIKRSLSIQTPINLLIHNSPLDTELPLKNLILDSPLHIQYLPSTSYY